MKDFVYLAIGFRTRRAGFLWLTRETDFAVLGIFTDSSLAVKNIETRLGQEISWQPKQGSRNAVLTAQNPLNEGWFEIRRVYLNVPNFSLEPRATQQNTRQTIQHRKAI